MPAAILLIENSHVITIFSRALASGFYDIVIN